MASPRSSDCSPKPPRASIARTVISTADCATRSRGSKRSDAREHRRAPRSVARSPGDPGGQRRPAEAETREKLGRPPAGLDKARSEAKSMSQLVNTSSLGALPTRKHAEQLLTELSERRQPFVVAAVALGDFKDLARRYGRRAGAGDCRANDEAPSSRPAGGLPSSINGTSDHRRHRRTGSRRRSWPPIGRVVARASKSSVNESDPELRDLRFEPRFGVHAAAKSEGLQSLVSESKS